MHKRRAARLLRAVRQSARPCEARVPQGAGALLPGDPLRPRHLRLQGVSVSVDGMGVGRKAGPGWAFNMSVLFVCYAARRCTLVPVGISCAALSSLFVPLRAGYGG